MSTARKVIDWQGQAGDELVRELANLPAGRYVLVTENELDVGSDGELSPDDEAALQEGLDDVERGATIPWEQARTDLLATIATARMSRHR